MPRGIPNDPNRTWSRQPKSTKRVAAPVKQKAPIVKRSAPISKQPRRNTMVAVGKANMEAAILSTMQSICNQLLRLEGAIYARPYVSQPIMQQAGALGENMARMEREKELAEKFQEMQRKANEQNNQMGPSCCTQSLAVNETPAPRRTRKSSNPNIKAVPEQLPEQAENGLNELSDDDMMV